MYEVYDFRFKEKEGELNYIVTFKNKVTNEKEKEYGSLCKLEEIPCTIDDKNDIIITSENMIYNQLINLPNVDVTYKVHNFIKIFFIDLVLKVNQNV